MNFHPVDARAFLGKSESEILKTDEYKVVKSADAAIAGAISYDLARSSVHDDVITLICKNLGLFGCFRSIKSFYNTINCSALNDKDEISNVDFLIVHDIAAKQFVEKGYKTGIDDVRAKLLPQDKVNQMDVLRQQYGPVLFVGDGINDAPVLATTSHSSPNAEAS